jgi:WD40 repeat protein/serine/threonine protein kinase
MPTDPRRLKELFVAAVDLPDVQARKVFLECACGDDAELFHRLSVLLKAHDDPASALNQPLAEVRRTTPEVSAVSRGPAELPGTVIVGRYKLLEKIGEGGMGTVWVAEQTQPVRRKVALKLVKAGMDSKQVLARFTAERQALALMDHPNIAKVLDGGTTEGGRPFFVMEYVKGVPFTRYCDEARLNIAQRLALFVPVCQAVQQAHQKGIIHRDLKPNNILVCLYDGQPVPKVIDFGLAKAIHQPLTDLTLHTAHGAMMGTPLYMSPEQAEFNNLDVDTRTDIYALGVVLYELLTGTTPLEQQRLQKAAWHEMLRLIKEEEPQRPSARLSGSGSLPTVAAQRSLEPVKLARLVRGELDWIVMKCLEKDRSRRYETVGGLARDVQLYLADGVVEARPPSARYRLSKFIRRNRGRVLAAALMLFALIGGVIGAAYGIIEADKQREITSLLQQAERERDAAEVARGEAESARDQERKAKRDVEEAREKLAAVEYGRTIQVALQAWRDNNIPAALALLDNKRANLRGWEWRYVHRLCHSDLLTVTDRTCSVLAASFSPDGSRVVTGRAENVVSVYDARTGVELYILKGHEADVRSASFSKDGSRLLTGSSDGTARIWDANTKAQLLPLSGRGGMVYCASFSPDESQVVTANLANTAKIWDANTGVELRTLKGHTGAVRSAYFNRDGTRVVTASEDGTAKMWDARTGVAMLTLEGHKGEVFAAAFSPDGSRIVTAGRDRTARIWDAKVGMLLLTLKGHADAIYSARFSPDASKVLTGSWDRTARIWEAKTGAELLTLRGHTDGIVSAEFSLDGERVVTAGHNDLTARIWDAKHGTQSTTLKSHSQGIHSVSFSPDGSRLATAGETAKLWDVRTGAELLAPMAPKNGVFSTSFSPDGSRLLTGNWDQTARVFDANTGVELLVLKGHTGLVHWAAYSPDGSQIVTASWDRTAKLRNSKTGIELRTLRGHADVVKSASFSPDGSQVATASSDGTTKLWDAKTGEEIRTLKSEISVDTASFSPDGRRLVTGGYDRTVRLWDAKTGAELFKLIGHTDAVVSASFSPDGMRIVTGSHDRTAKVWDAITGAELLTLQGHSDDVNSVSFSPDGLRLATGSRDRTAKIWDATPVNQQFLGKPHSPPPGVQ